MKYAKMLGLLVVAAAALMAFAGSASATELTDGTNTKLPVGTVIHANNTTNTVLDGTVNITCKKSTIQGSVTNAGGSTTTVEGSISTLTFEECGNNTVTVSKGGTLIAHTHQHQASDGTWTETEGTTYASLTSTGAEVTVLTHNILGTVHCIYKTNATPIGTVHNSDHQDATGLATTAVVTVDSLPIPQTPTDFGCGSNAEWTATYSIDSPDHLDID